MIDEAYITKNLVRLAHIEKKLSDPATAADQKAFRSLVREHSRLRKLQQKVSALRHAETAIQENHEILGSGEADAELKELAEEELERLEQSLPILNKDLMHALLPPDPNEGRNAIMEIRAGTGGEEAALFAADLFRMYHHFAEQKGWKIEIMDSATTGVGGYKEAVFSVKGEGAYDALEYEGGGHRVQRVPVTESQGRIHTSAATVAVFPEVEPEDDIELPPDEVRIDIFRSSGPGGQSVNTTDSAVRVTHLPTGIIVQCQDEKSQHRNREKAMLVLKARILDKRRMEEQEKMGKTRRLMIGSGDRSARVRTYNFPQNRLTDHRINLTLYSLDRIMEGDIDDLVSALHEHDTDLRMQEEFRNV